MALSLAGYGALCWWMPLVPHYGRLPLLDVRAFSPSLGAGLLYGLLLVALFALYGLAYQKVREGERPFPLPLLLLTTALFILPLLFTYPINANDIYRYAIRGHATSYYRTNPFTMPLSQLPDTSLAAYAGEWVDATTPYGPV